MISLSLFLSLLHSIHLHRFTNAWTCGRGRGRERVFFYEAFGFVGLNWEGYGFGGRQSMEGNYMGENEKGENACNMVGVTRIELCHSLLVFANSFKFYCLFYLVIYILTFLQIYKLQSKI